jgi:hypothetical protein
MATLAAWRRSDRRRCTYCRNGLAAPGHGIGFPRANIGSSGPVVALQTPVGWTALVLRGAGPFAILCYSTIPGPDSRAESAHELNPCLVAAGSLLPVRKAAPHRALRRQPAASALPSSAPLPAPQANRILAHDERLGDGLAGPASKRQQHRLRSVSLAAITRSR